MVSAFDRRDNLPQAMETRMLSGVQVWRNAKG
jgi:hypothetical protein